MPDKATRLTIRLGEDVRAWLKAEGAKRGLDEAAFARMVLYERMNGQNYDLLAVRPSLVAPGLRTTERAHLARYPGERSDEGAPVYTSAPSEIQSEEELVAAGEPRAEEMDIPPDADGGDPNAAFDALMQAGPTFLDELLAAAKPPAPARQEGYRFQRSREARRAPTRGRSQQGFAPAGYSGPGSLTRPIGVNNAIAGGNIQGDGVGNVLRDNNRHFGFVGTRAR